jgi:hypothetical protein
MTSAMVFQIQSTLIVILMTVGIYYRKNRKLHIPIMTWTMIWDVLLILQIELTRGAIKKASQVPVNPMILNIHVSLALLTVIFYGAMIYTGSILKSDAKSNPAIKKRHRWLGITTYTLRLLTYATSFYAVSPSA